jgi:hypothetical protein
MEPVKATVRVILVVAAIIMFGIAAFVYPAPVEPYRLRFTAAGLFCWSLSMLFS